MRPARPARPHLLSVAAIGLLAACAQVPPHGGKLPFVDDTHKAELSRLDSSGVIVAPEIERHLDEVMAGLQRAAGAQGQALAPIKVYVTGSGNPNASALDGKVYVPWRALSLIGTDRELAALLAHEASHLLLRHAEMDAASAWIGPLSNLAMLAAATTGIGVGALLVSLSGQYADRAMVAGWQRDQELQADALGIRLMRSAGYDEIGFVDLLETLSQAVASAPFKPAYVERRRADGRSQYQFNPGAQTFGGAEASHPATALRREQAAQTIEADAATPAPPAPSSAPVRGWPELKATPSVAALLTGLEAADEAMRADPRRHAPEARAQARQALASPAAASYPAYVAALATLPGPELRAAGLPAPIDRLLAPGTPISGPVVVLRTALQSGNGLLAAQSADLIDARYDAPTVLYHWLARAHELRSGQIRGQMQRPGLPIAEQMALLAESVARDGRAMTIRSKCLALARNPNGLASCGPKQ